MAKVKIGINGFGRIGRGVVRALAKEKTAFDLALINDLTDAKTLGHLLKYDSVHGRYPGDVEVSEKGISVSGDTVQISAERDPAKIPWKEHDVDIVLECTGRFVDRENASKHIAGGAKKVLISAPAKGPDATFAMGVNHTDYDPAKHHVISNASCTTNCLAQIAKVLHESFGITYGVMTTIHSYTNDQSVLDLPHKDMRRARAAAMSMIPTTTGAAKALKEVIPSLEGKFDGMAIRVPTPNVSLVDLVAKVGKKTTAEEVNSALTKAANGPLKGFLAVSNEPLVSIDYNGNPHSAIADLGVTSAHDDLVKVLAWYDNETGYSNRLFDLTKFVASKL